METVMLMTQWLLLLLPLLVDGCYGCSHLQCHAAAAAIPTSCALCALSYVLLPPIHTAAAAAWPAVAAAGTAACCFQVNTCTATPALYNVTQQ
jgi:hypothetical protein